MCQFFSITSDGQGRIKYFNWELRKKCLSGKFDYNPDSHTSINDYFGFTRIKEDKRNKYEFNPIIGKFTVDQINGKNDRISVEKKVRALDFKTIVPQLVIKSIINPLEIKPNMTVAAAIKLLNKWAAVRASVWASVRDSVRDSVWAYMSSYFAIDRWKYINHRKGYNPYTPCIKLFEAGYVPSFDGKKWRLHTIDGIVWESEIRKN